MTKYFCFFKLNGVKIFSMKIFKAASVLAAVFFNITLLSAPKIYAQAESGYKYAYVDIDVKVYFCKSKNLGDALFEIPNTYCLEILGQEDGWLKVKYADDDGVFQALYGFCKHDGLILSNEEPAHKYLKQTVTVTYQTEDIGNMLEGLPSIVFDAAYYGALTAGSKRCSYVYCNGYFGYITGAIENYPLNPLPSTPTFSPTQNEPQGASAATLITAVAITAVAVVAISVLYFSSKKPPKTLL